MRRSRDIRTVVITYLFFACVTIWLGILVAPYAATGRELITNLAYVLQHPTDMHFCPRTIPCVSVCLLVFGMCVLMHETNRKNYRRKEEHGSAAWGTPRTVNKHLADKNMQDNRILTSQVRIGYDSHVHRRNLNTMVIGGSGAGKTRNYAMPNIMQANTSFVVLDPKGEILRNSGSLLEGKGYVIRVLDLINMEKSHCYNPFCYIKTDDDIQKIATNIFKATIPKGSSEPDPFWPTMAEILLKALMFYLFHEAPEEEQNFSMVMEMIRAGEVKEEDEEYQSPLDLLFKELEQKNPTHIAVITYKNYRHGAAKTIESIQSTLVARLAKFDLESLRQLTITDELNLANIGEQKTALFAVIPDNDTSYNFLVSMLYTQIFQTLYYQADIVHHGRLPMHVHFLMDEFANVALPDDFEKLLATMRSREISVSIILQNMAQLKALFKDSHESIRGNCDELLYLGGNESATHKMVSEDLGKETIDTNTYGHTKGRNGSYTTNDQSSGRELLTPDEVRMLPLNGAVLFVRGERQVEDMKYDLTKHPNYHLTNDGGAKPYIHGQSSSCHIRITDQCTTGAYVDVKAEKYRNYEYLSNEQIERFYGIS